MTRENLIYAIKDEVPCLPSEICNTMMSCYECAEKRLEEYEKQIKADLIDKVLEQVKCYLTDNLQLENATKYGNETQEQMENSYSTVMKYEIAMCVEDLVESIEQLKGE